MVFVARVHPCTNRVHRLAPGLLQTRGGALDHGQIRLLCSSALCARFRTFTFPSVAHSRSQPLTAAHSTVCSLALAVESVGVNGNND